jgi:hypothetical protein
LSLCSTRAAAGLGLSVLDDTRASDRVFLLDGDGRQCSYPVCWTDAVEPDLSVSFAAGRSRFRVDDPFTLARVIGGL